MSSLGFPLEVLLSAGYSAFLLGVAALLEKAAVLSRRRADQYELAGFRYHSDFDHWECPAGSRLVRVETDLPRRMVRYRAPAGECNACALKQDCTDSDSGREIEHRLDLWFQSGLSRFHRGVSLTLIVLAACWSAAEALRYPDRRSAALLGGLLVVAAVLGLKLLSYSRSESRGRINAPQKIG